MTEIDRVLNHVKCDCCKCKFLFQFQSFGMKKIELVVLSMVDLCINICSNFRVLE